MRQKDGMTDKANTKCPLAILWRGHKNDFQILENEFQIFEYLENEFQILENVFQILENEYQIFVNEFQILENTDFCPHWLGIF